MSADIAQSTPKPRVRTSVERSTHRVRFPQTATPSLHVAMHGTCRRAYPHARLYSRDAGRERPAGLVRLLLADIVGTAETAPHTCARVDGSSRGSPRLLSGCVQPAEVPPSHSRVAVFTHSSTRPWPVMVAKNVDALKVVAAISCVDASSRFSPSWEVAKSPAAQLK
jgi:hypothetical protein